VYQSTKPAIDKQALSFSLNLVMKLGFAISSSPFKKHYTCFKKGSG